MLPLSAETIPTTIDEFTAALSCGWEKLAITPRRLETQGVAFPQMEALQIDLTGAVLTRDFKPQRASGGNDGEVEIAQFGLIGAPIYFEKTPLEVRLAAEEVKAHLELSGAGLVLDQAKSGTVSVQIDLQALEALVHGFAVEAASKQGLEVRKTKLNFTQEGPRGVSFRAEVQAKVFVMSATLALTGRLTIDDELKARVSHLQLDGEGMILKLAGGYARPYLDRLEGRVFPLLAFAPGGLKLRDVEFNVGSALKVRAQFGAA